MVPRTTWSNSHRAVPNSYPTTLGCKVKHLPAHHRLRAHILLSICPRIPFNSVHGRISIKYTVTTNRIHSAPTIWTLSAIPHPQVISTYPLAPITDKLNKSHYTLTLSVMILSID